MTTHLLANRKALNASVATDLDGRCAINIGDELFETEHVAQGCERWVGRVGFPAAVDGSFVSKGHSPMDVKPR